MALVNKVLPTFVAAEFTCAGWVGFMSFLSQAYIVMEAMNGSSCQSVSIFVLRALPTVVDHSWAFEEFLVDLLHVVRPPIPQTF